MTASYITRAIIFFGDVIPCFMALKSAAFVYSQMLHWSIHICILTWVRSLLSSAEFGNRFQFSFKNVAKISSLWVQLCIFFHQQSLQMTGWTLYCRGPQPLSRDPLLAVVCLERGCMCVQFNLHEWWAGVPAHSLTCESCRWVPFPSATPSHKSCGLLS